MSIKITIGQKFSFAFLIILLLMALTFGIVIKSYNSVITNLETTNEDASKQGAAGNVRFSIAQLIMFANDYIITEKDYYRQMFEQQRMRVADYQKKLRMLCFSSREFAIVDSIAVDVDSINAYAHRIFAISKPRLSPEAATLMEIMDHKFGDAVNRKTTEIFDIVFGKIEELRIQSAHSKEQMLNTIYTVFSLALLVSLVFVFLSVQRIVKPIKTIVKAADEIAKGDYTQRPVVKTHDEVALLARSFYRMIEAVEKSHLELDSSKCFTENIYATVPSGLLVFGKEAKVLSVNKSFCELFDLDQQHIIGQSIDDVLQLIGISQKCKDVVAAREPFRNLECVSPHDTKKKMTLNLTLSEIHNAEEEVLLVIEDITERRIAEEMIKKSEVLFRTTLYSIGDAVITTNEHGIVQRLNPVAEHLTGWKEFDAHGKSIEDVFNIINEETRNKVENPVQKVLREGVIVGLANHTLLISKDGIEAPIADSGAPIKNETGDIVGVVLVFRDQTEEREKQKTLEHSNARLKEAQRMTHIGNWELDIWKNKLYWCDEIFRMFEIDQTELEASYEAFLNTVHPDDREFVNNAYTESVKNKTPYNIDHRLLMKDGRIKYVHEQCETYYNDQGHPIRSSGTVQDITERVKANAVIAEQAEQLNVILATTSDGFWVVNQFGKIIDVNDAYCKMSGYTRTEILSFSISDLDAKESAEETTDHIKKVIEKGSDIFESVHKTKDGKYLLVEVSVSYSPAKRQFLGFCRDITERKRAEEALMAAEAKYRMLVEQVPTIIYTTSVGETTATLYISPQSEAVLGYSPNEWLADPEFWLKHLHSDDRESVAARYAHAALMGELFCSEYRMLTRDGRVVWLHDEATIVRSGESQYLQGIAIDITERKRAEEALLISERKYKDIFSFAPLGIYQSSLDGKFITVNKALIKILGYNSSDEMTSLDMDADVYYEKGERAKLIARFEPEGSVADLELRWKKKDRTSIWIQFNSHAVKDADGRTLHFEGFVHDITERKKLEKELKEYGDHLEEMVAERTVELRQSEERFRALAEGSEDIITRFDSSHQHLYVNPVVKKITGLKADDYIGKTYQQLGFPDELVKLWDETLKKTFLTKKMNRTEFELPNGIWIDWIIIPEFDELGNVNTVVTSGRDITELKEYEKKINEALNKEKELNQLKSTFISTASHQFRTPLASILSSAQMIKRYANKWSEEKLNEHHKRIHESIKNLTKLMDDVLLVSKSEKGKDSLKPEEADVEELFNKFIEEVKPLLNEKQEINYKNSVAKKYIKIDKKALQQIVNNLLLNAVKYSPEGGTIKIETGFEDGKLKIIVEDKGVGIPKEEIKYIFDSFYRTTNAVNFPGTGLGLNIVKRMVDLYKGTIDVASELNKNTKFIIILPINPVNE